jgi:fluoride exporter
MTLGLFLAVAAGGFVGAPSRYLLDRSISGRAHSGRPWGTFVINVTGSLLLGFLTGLTMTGHLSEIGKALLGTGFCGAYTTFSTFTFESVRLLEDGRIVDAMANVVISVAVGLAAAAAGLAIGLAM